MMMCGVLRALSKAQGRWDMMAGHHQCTAKHQINAYLMVKVWTCGIDGSLQSSLPMPRLSSHGSNWLSKLPLTSVKVVEHTGIIREATSRAPGTTSCPRCSCAGARHGQGSARPRTVRPQIDLLSQDLLRPIASGPGPEVETLIWGSYQPEN